MGVRSTFRRDVLRHERSHECLREMRTLRLLGWEDIAEDIVNKQRIDELGWRSFRMYLYGVSYWLMPVAGRLLTFAQFCENAQHTNRLQREGGSGRPTTLADWEDS